jgi:hypothetical protein
MKRNKFTDFILSLEEKISLGNFYVQKKYVLIGILGIIIYIFIAVYNANSVRITNVGEKREADYKELNERQEIETFTEIPDDTRTYEKSISEILEMSNEEIRTLLKEQNIFLTDEEILKFKEEVRKNFPKEEELMKNEEEFKRLEEETMRKIHEEAEKMAKNQNSGN